MKAITVRNIPSELVRVIRQRANEKHTSVNKAVIGLLEESLGTRIKRKDKSVYDDLDALAGTWSNEEYSGFEKALSRQRAIDPDLWK